MDFLIRAATMTDYQARKSDNLLGWEIPSGRKIMSIYVENGFKNRNHYLEYLAEEYCIDKHWIFVLAEALGSNEDFDGLIVCLEDYFNSDYYLSGEPDEMLLSFA